MFGLEPKESLLHEMVRAEQASRRQGTHATKTRGQVAGGRAKPFRQKGTGRARQGTTRSAQHAGGGVVFGPQPRSYSVKVNRKAYLKARKMALSLHASEGSIGVFDGAFDAPAHQGRHHADGEVARGPAARGRHRRHRGRGRLLVPQPAEDASS